MEKINQEIDVVAYFNPKGEIRPIKFKIKGQDEEEIEIKVSLLKGRKVVKNKEKAYIDFLCESVFDNIEKEYVLRYEARGLKWLLYYM